jgi:ankyrin repeat protein
LSSPPQTDLSPFRGRCRDESRGYKHKYPLEGLWILIALTPLLAGATIGRSPLIEAARAGDREALLALIQRQSDVNAAEPDGSTALHWAAYRDDLDSADQLLRAGANANAANDLGATPLWAAAQNGSAKMVRRLLEAGANPNATLSAGETPLMVAARGGYLEVAEMLAAKGANTNARAARGQTALMWAVAQRHPDVVKILLAHGANVKTRSDTWSEVMAVPPHGYLPYNRSIPHGADTALLFAARGGDLESAKLLVASGADVKDQDAWGVTAVTLAAHSGFRSLVEFFLEKGADPNVEGPGFTSLHEAIMRRDEKMVAALLEHGADPNIPLKTWTPTRRSSKDFHFEPTLVGASPLWMAARFTEPGVMRMLIHRGADPLFVHHAASVSASRFETRKDTSTVLMAAVGMGGLTNPWAPIPVAEREVLALETVKFCVELGVDINATNPGGSTALDGAKALGFETVVKFLNEKGAKSGKPFRQEVPREN